MNENCTAFVSSFVVCKLKLLFIRNVTSPLITKIKDRLIKKTILIVFLFLIFRQQDGRNGEPCDPGIIMWQHPYSRPLFLTPLHTPNNMLTKLKMLLNALLDGTGFRHLAQEVLAHFLKYK